MTPYQEAGYPSYGSIDDPETVKSLIVKLSTLKGRDLDENLAHVNHVLSDKFINLKNWLFRVGCVVGYKVSRTTVRQNLIDLLDGKQVAQYDWALYD